MNSEAVTSLDAERVLGLNATLSHAALFESSNPLEAASEGLKKPSRPTLRHSPLLAQQAGRPDASELTMLHRLRGIGQKSESALQGLLCSTQALTLQLLTVAAGLRSSPRTLATEAEARSASTESSGLEGSEPLASDLLAPDLIAPDLIAPDLLAPDLIASELSLASFLSDPLAVSLDATQTPEGFRLSGSLPSLPFVRESAWLLVQARVGAGQRPEAAPDRPAEVEPSPQGHTPSDDAPVALFRVPLPSQGVQLNVETPFSPDHQAAALRLENVLAECLLPPQSWQLERPRQLARHLRLLHAHWWGLLEQLFEKTIAHVKVGKAHGKPLAEAQSVRLELSELKLRLELVGRMLTHTVSHAETELRQAVQVSAQSLHLLLQAVETSLSIASRLLVDAPAPLQAFVTRLKTDAHLLLATRGASDALRSLIARSLLLRFQAGQPSAAQQPESTMPLSAALNPALNPALEPTMQGAFSEAQRSFSQAFYQRCQQDVAPSAADVDRRGALSPQAWQAVVDSQYLRLFHPKRLGGLEADGGTLGLAMEHLSAACGSTFWVASVSTLLCGKLLASFGSEALQRRWLDPILEGKLLGLFAVSEDASTSELAPPATRLTRDGDAFVLSGKKSRISNVGAATVGLIRARSDAHITPENPTGELYAVVDLRAPGVRAETVQKLGLHGMPWGYLHLEGVKVQADELLCSADRVSSFKAAEWGQLFQAFSSIGFARTALETCLAYASERRMFGHTLSELPVVYHRLADMATELQAARLLALDAADLKARDQLAGPVVQLAKVYATEMAVRVLDAAHRILGGWGYDQKFPIERLYRDALGNLAAGAASDRLREFAGCALVGGNPWAYEPLRWCDGLFQAPLPPQTST